MIVNSVFTTNDDDLLGACIETRYVFKSVNLNQAEASIGHWIIYYRPIRAARSALPPGYIAIARVEGIDPEPVRQGYLLARMADYRGFDRTVPFKEGGHYYEKALRRADATGNPGAFSLGVRNLSPNEFERIVVAGLAAAVFDIPSEFPDPDPVALPEPGLLYAAEEPATFLHELPLMVPRRFGTSLVTRPVRDPAFVVLVNAVYGSRCAMSQSGVIDRYGRSEVDAAHIRPVAQGGPDTVCNGIALSRSVHGYFDSGLISVADDYTILIASRLRRDDMRGWPPLLRKMVVPTRPELRPHPSYLQFHRENVFEG